jgi:tetratricopeptide (TPR) repeat protein
MAGMTMPSGADASMPGMAMPSQPSRPPASPTGDLRAAHADVEAGRFARAIPVYERALEADPHNLDARIHLGVSLAGVGQVERGLAELDGALAMDADNLHALWSKAQALFDDGRYGASIPVWERVAARAGNSPDAAAARDYALEARQRLEGQPKRGPEKKSR